MDWFILAFISAVFSAASAISEKKALFSLDALDFSFIVSLVTLFFTIPFFTAVEFDLIFSRSIGILFLKTMLGAASYLCVMLAIKNLEISEALPLLALSPGIVAVSGIFLINDYLIPFEWIGILLMLVGTYVLEVRESPASDRRFKVRRFLLPFTLLFTSSKYLYVLIALVLLSISSLLDRVLLKGFSLPPYTFMAFQQLFYMLIFLLLFLLKNKGNFSPVKRLGKNLFILIIFISIFTVIYRYTQIEATKIAPAALVLSVKRLSVLMAIIFGGRLFSEGRLKSKIIAAIIILTGVTILAVF